MSGVQDSHWLPWWMYIHRSLCFHHTDKHFFKSPMINNTFLSAGQLLALFLYQHCKFIIALHFFLMSCGKSELLCILATIKAHVMYAYMCWTFEDLKMLLSKGFIGINRWRGVILMSDMMCWCCSLFLDTPVLTVQPSQGGVNTIGFYWSQPQ